MQDKFDTDLRAAFEFAKKCQSNVEHIKKLAREDPEGLARRITVTLPEMMEELRKEAAEEWGVDIADLDGLKGAAGSRDPVEAFSLLDRVDLYHAFGELLQRIGEYADDTSLSREELAKKVCEVGEEVQEVEEASKLHTLHQIYVFAESYSSEEAAQMARNVLAQQLAGHLATRTSARVNLRLAYALDELRERKKPQSRERLEVLLRELCAKAPEVWDENHRTDWRLRTTRDAVLKKIERRLPPREYKEVELTPLTERHALEPEEAEPSEEAELAAFATWQAIHKRAREVGLTPRERELFALVTGDPERFIKNGRLDHSEAAREMGLKKGSIKSLWYRIRQTLIA